MPRLYKFHLNSFPRVGAHGSVHVPYRAVLVWKSTGAHGGLPRRFSVASLGHLQAPGGGDRRTSTASSAGVAVSAGNGIGSADRRASLAVGSLGLGVEHWPSFNASAVGAGARRSSVPAAVSASASLSRCASPVPLSLVPIVELPNEERTEQQPAGADNATADVSGGGGSGPSASGLPILSAENLLRCVTPRPVTPSLNQRRSSHVASPGPMSLIVPTLPVSHRSRNSSSGGGHRLRHSSEQATFVGQVLFQNLQIEYNK